MHVGGSIASEVSHAFFWLDDASSSAADTGWVVIQVKRQAETRLREHFSEPLRAKVQAAVEDEDDARDTGRRVPEPL
jgi:hypothetical protein